MIDSYAEKKIAVLIPCYNEAMTIEKVVSDWKAELPGAVIYVYDNNSSDDTAAVAEKAGAVVRREYAQGKGNVIRRMFRDIEADCYLMVDGDDTYDAGCAKEMVRLVLETDTDMVVGDRLSSTYFTENKRPFHNFGNTLVRKSINKLFNANVKDIMTGCRAFSRQFVKTFPVLSKGFEIETEMTIHADDKNMRIEVDMGKYSVLLHVLRNTTFPKYVLHWFLWFWHLAPYGEAIFRLSLEYGYVHPHSDRLMH